MESVESSNSRMSPFVRGHTKPMFALINRTNQNVDNKQRNKVTHEVAKISNQGQSHMRNVDLRF